MRPADAPGNDDPRSRAALVEQVRVTLQVKPSFPVLGLSHPALTPSRLVELEQVAGRLERLSLGYGEAEHSAGRFVMVSSGEPGRDLPDLAALLAAEETRLGEEITQDPPIAPDLTPAGGLRLNIPMELDGVIVVDGLPVPAHLRRQGRVWAAHIEVSPGRRVTVLARGVDPGQLQLSEVIDLRPYVAAWEEHHLKGVTNPGYVPAGSVAAEAGVVQGLDAHVTLLRRTLVARAGAPRHSGDQVVVGRDGTAEHAALWDDAVRAQAHYASQDLLEAEAAVTSMVNQAVRLAERGSWAGERRRVEQALEEMARYTVFESDVPSRRAQEWWGRVWSLSTTPPPSDPAQARERHREFSATEAVWLTAWERWADGDDGRTYRRH